MELSAGAYPGYGRTQEHFRLRPQGSRRQRAWQST